MAAGFSFTKLDANGDALANQATQNPPVHACVKDNVTGLTWEVKTTTGKRSKDKTYRWGGLTAIGIDHARKEGRYYPDWDELVKYANDTDDANDKGGPLCGVIGWRVPNIFELRSIAHLGRRNPAIDPNYFPNTKSYYYWSSSPSVRDSGPGGRSWALYFRNGNDEDSQRGDGSRHVRLVRGGQ